MAGFEVITEGNGKGGVEGPSAASLHSDGSLIDGDETSPPCIPWLA
jgi:hypothetical protein